MKRRIRWFLYSPPAWIVDHTTAEDRRTFGFWSFVVSLICFPIFGRISLYISSLSLLALIPNFTAETPKEDEDE